MLMCLLIFNSNFLIRQCKKLSKILLKCIRIWISGGILDYTIEYLGMEDGEIIISSIKECVREGNKLIYIGYTVTQFYGTYDYYTTPADPMLIISLDNGNSWELATPSVDVSNILKYKFSRQSVEKVLNDIND